MSGWKRRTRVWAAALLVPALLLGPWLWLEGDGGEAVPALGEESPRYVALTFDDGPKRETTEPLLDGLAKRGVHATFFVVGENVPGNEDLLLRMAAEGHQVGMHTNHHKILTGMGAADFYREVGELRLTLTDLLGAERFMLRPPYGMADAGTSRRAGAPIVLWSVDPQDWSDRNSPRQVSAILDAVGDGDIILLHDIYESSVETALSVVDTLQAQGYYFVTVEELFAVRGRTPEDGKVYRRLPPS